MLRFSTAAPTTLVPRFVDLIVRWAPGNRLRRSLADLSDEELDRLLSATGRDRGDLFTVFKGNARHRQLMALMIEHFGVDREYAVQSSWDALRYADRVCVRCANSKRCESWFSWGLRNDAPRIFCPNAELFDEIAQAPLSSRFGALKAAGPRGRKRPRPRQ